MKYPFLTSTTQIMFIMTIKMQSYVIKQPFFNLLCWGFPITRGWSVTHRFNLKTCKLLERKINMDWNPHAYRVDRRENLYSEPRTYADRIHDTQRSRNWRGKRLSHYVIRAVNQSTVKWVNVYAGRVFSMLLLTLFGDTDVNIFIIVFDY